MNLPTTTTLNAEEPVQMFQHL